MAVFFGLAFVLGAVLTVISLCRVAAQADRAMARMHAADDDDLGATDDPYVSVWRLR